ncbi:ThuA domain-containing protein [Cohnella sp. GCM10027633]|uniref:ThuA domain-containing protein n=1 Tax=unclassified Cohnella TaxID=2636738 RepID=UPI00363CF9A2
MAKARGSQESIGSLQGKRVAIVSGEDEYRSEESLASVAEELRSRYGAEVALLTCQPDPRAADHLPGLSELEQADLMIVYLRFRRLPEEQFRYIRAYLERGGPVIAFRTSTHAFDYPEGHPLREWNRKFGIDVLGAPWIRHFGHSSITDVNADRNSLDHPVLRGVPQRFVARSWLYDVFPYPEAAGEAEVLMNGYAVHPEHGTADHHTLRIHPVVWTRKHYGGGRTMTTTLGHPEDFELQAFRQIISNGVHWALDIETPDEFGENGRTERC